MKNVTIITTCFTNNILIINAVLETLVLLSAFRLDNSHDMPTYEPLDSPISEVDIHDYDPNSDVPLPAPMDYSEAEQHMPGPEAEVNLWDDVINESDGQCSSVHSSEVSEEEVAFLPEVDFASAVARAAQLSGLTVIDPVTGREKGLYSVYNDNIDNNILYCIVFKYLYSAPQQPWANRGAFGSISSKKRDKF